MAPSTKPFSWADFEADVRADSEVPKGAKTLRDIAKELGIHPKTMGDRLAALAKDGKVGTKLAPINSIRQRVYWFQDAEISGNVGDKTRVPVRRGGGNAGAGAEAGRKAGRKA